MRQYIYVELFQKLCINLATDRSWSDEGLRTTNIYVVDLEAQELENFPEWRENLRVSLEKIGWEEAAAKDLQVKLGVDKSTQNRHADDLTLIFDKLSVFQEGVLQKIRTVTEIVENMEASFMMGFIDQGSNQLEALVEHISDLEKYRIPYRLRIDGLESRINAGDYELVIV